MPVLVVPDPCDWFGAPEAQRPISLTICPDCDGDGEVQLGTASWREPHGEYVTDAVMGLCPTCDGLGAVEDEHPEPQTVADALAREGETAPSAPSDYLDTYEVLALAAAELKCAADTILATRCIPEALLGTTLARLDAAAAVVRAMKERTT